MGVVISSVIGAGVIIAGIITTTLTVEGRYEKVVVHATDIADLKEGQKLIKKDIASTRRQRTIDNLVNNIFRSGGVVVSRGHRRGCASCIRAKDSRCRYTRDRLYKMIFGTYDPAQCRGVK